MRTAVLIAVTLLVAGCSHATVGEPGQATAAGPGSSRPATASSAAPTSSAQAAPPGPGAAISDVIAWIEAGKPAEATGYHSATRDGETTELGDDLAFQAGGTSCMTDTGHAGGALACLVNLAEPPPPPDGVYGEWKGNWVDFDGATVQIGSVHADPGPFHRGAGPELPAGATLSFGDYRCRADRTGVFCVNYAHRAAVRFASTGVEPFGCLQPAPATEGVGTLLRC